MPRVTLEMLNDERDIRINWSKLYERYHAIDWSVYEGDYVGVGGTPEEAEQDLLDHLYDLQVDSECKQSDLLMEKV